MGTRSGGGLPRGNPSTQGRDTKVASVTCDLVRGSVAMGPAICQVTGLCSGCRYTIVIMVCMYRGLIISRSYARCWRRVDRDSRHRLRLETGPTSRLEITYTRRELFMSALPIQCRASSLYIQVISPDNGRCTVPYWVHRLPIISWLGNRMGFAS